ncbi:MAG: HD domain-containing protein [Vicinamibacterales bacterium]
MGLAHHDLLTERFDAALLLAHKVHRRQTRKQTSVPYMAHVMAVTALVLDYGGSEDQAIAALLHDAVEDAPAALGPEWVRAQIAEHFGPAVLDIVNHCTDTDETPKPPWRARKIQYVDAAKDAPLDALLVSSADKLHNVTALLRDFRREGHAVWSRFNSAGKTATIGYYRALADIARVRLNSALSLDLHTVVSTLEREADLKGTWPPPDQPS